MSVGRYSVGVKRTDHAERRGGMTPGWSDRQPEAIHEEADASAVRIHPTAGAGR
jgi:hypothetical protein